MMYTLSAFGNLTQMRQLRRVGHQIWDLPYPGWADVDNELLHLGLENGLVCVSPLRFIAHLTGQPSIYIISLLEPSHSSGFVCQHGVY